jgi:hypothetical protein
MEEDQKDRLAHGCMRRAPYKNVLRATAADPATSVSSLRFALRQRAVSHYRFGSHPSRGSGCCLTLIRLILRLHSRDHVRTPQLIPCLVGPISCGRGPRVGASRSRSSLRPSGRRCPPHAHRADGPRRHRLILGAARSAPDFPGGKVVRVRSRACSPALEGPSGHLGQVGCWAGILGACAAVTMAAASSERDPHVSTGSFYKDFAQPPPLRAKGR